MIVFTQITFNISNCNGIDDKNEEANLIFMKSHYIFIEEHCDIFTFYLIYQINSVSVIKSSQVYKKNCHHKVFSLGMTISL